MIHPDKLDITDPERIEDMEETEIFDQFLLRFKLHAYVQKLRSEETNLLLKEESLTIAEVVKRVGYKHQEYFSKSFFAT